MSWSLCGGMGTVKQMSFGSGGNRLPFWRNALYKTCDKCKGQTNKLIMSHSQPPIRKSLACKYPTRARIAMSG
eukprot:4675529-Amphidinium_carterae.1